MSDIEIFGRQSLIHAINDEKHDAKENEHHGNQGNAVRVGYLILEHQADHTRGDSRRHEGPRDTAVGGERLAAQQRPNPGRGVLHHVSPEISDCPR